MTATTLPKLSQITRAQDGARILWRNFLASDDSRAAEGHVREFTADGAYVRVAETVKEDDKGEWLRVSDLRLVAVLAEHVAIEKKAKRKPRRIEGDEWKDTDTGELGLGGDQ